MGRGRGKSLLEILPSILELWGQDLSRSLGDFFQAPKVISTGDELERKLLPPKEGRHPDLFSKR